MNDKFLKELLFSNEQIVKRSKELAQWIDETYKDSKNLILLGLLKGSIPFLSELMKHISITHEIDFMVVSSYEGTFESKGQLKIILDLSSDIKGKDVLIVEDIVDTGKTLNEIVTRLKARNPKSLRTITLLNKKANRKNNFKPDNFGFEIENEFVYGFGLDVKEKFRNLPYIGIFKKELIDEV